jgi:hypothetical protein
MHSESIDGSTGGAGIAEIAGSYDPKTAVKAA